MTLYHFCADRHIKGILHNGLMEGGLTEITPHGFILHTGWIWLTTDPDAKKTELGNTQCDSVQPHGLAFDGRDSGQRA